MQIWQPQMKRNAMYIVQKRVLNNFCQSINTAKTHHASGKLRESVVFCKESHYLYRNEIQISKTFLYHHVKEICTEYTPFKFLF